MISAGTTLNDRYLLTARIGGGGMGEVWRADDSVLGRVVAVKVLMPALTDRPTFAKRFQNEARAMATLRHPGVVDVYDYGSCQVGERRVSFLVMEYVDGESLDRLLTRAALTPEATMRLVAEVADALAAAHEQGIVHRDVKPANLMIRADGRVSLTDFGIAHSVSAGQLTATGTMLCSAGYCAPEQATASDVTPAVDVYALGVVAYECLTGRLPYDGDTPVQIIFKHLNAPLPPLPRDVPPAPRHVVARAMEKTPDRRWPSASAMAAAAREAAERPGAEPRRRRGMTVTLAISAALLATVVLSTPMLMQQRAQQLPVRDRVVPVEVLLPTGQPSSGAPERQQGKPLPVRATPTPRVTVSGGVTVTITPTAPPPKPTPTATPTATPTPTPTVTRTPDPEPTSEPSVSASPEPTVEPTVEPSGTVEPVRQQESG
ncbi:serine/threonine-protein kinase [Nonomuraea sp. NPDC050556]|uniref:serine/threonine-protein kinase n=1 Tax=Nonomuraea sp. NPDC050556 TaxID=3364369 RepID=UPI00378B6D64